MGASDATRLSVTLIDVHPGREHEFVPLARQDQAVVEQKGYGRVKLVRDEATPSRFYVACHWVDASSAQRCHEDPDVRGLMSQIDRIARVSDVVNGARKADGGMDLVAAARRARDHAVAAYSKFKVGAALETADGPVVTGCNIENATYGLTICAERVAMFKALSEGHRAFTRIAIVADTAAPTPPCGACRQILWEFGGDLEVVLANLTGSTGVHRLTDLLPLPFDARLL